MNSKLSIWVERVTSSQTLILGGTALLVGLSTGVGVWAFKGLFELLRQAAFNHVTGWMIVLIPVIGGLVVGAIVKYLIGPEKLHGTARIMQAVALTGGRLRYKNAPIKTAAAILSIGTGASVGPEDPAVQIGANSGLDVWAGVSPVGRKNSYVGGGWCSQRHCSGIQCADCRRFLRT